MIPGDEAGNEHLAIAARAWISALRVAREPHG